MGSKQELISIIEDYVRYNSLHPSQFAVSGDAGAMLLDESDKYPESIQLCFSMSQKHLIHSLPTSYRNHKFELIVDHGKWSNYNPYISSRFSVSTSHRIKKRS
jgi:hypothetical protein